MTGRVLAIDAGNTRVKWGVFDGGKWNPCGALPTAEAARLGEQWAAIDNGVQAIASNVAGSEVQERLREACASRGWNLATIASKSEQLGVKNGYRNPAQLGSDRWAGLVAAHHAHRGNKLVVNAGTALTVDALGDDGRFLGGVIMPGPMLMRQALDRGTAGLRLMEGSFEAFPRSTPDAITTGAVQACAGSIDRMRAAMAAHEMATDVIIVSGGAAAEITSHLPGRVIVEDNLVLDGLLLMANA